MTTQTEALRMALEFIESVHQGEWSGSVSRHQAKEAIKEALAQPEQEPVAWMNDEMDCIFFDAERPEPFDFDFWKPLYTTPPQRKPLTYVDLRRIASQCGLGANEVSAQAQAKVDNFARAIESAHGIKE